MDSQTILAAVVFFIGGVGLLPLIRYFYSLTKNSDDITKNIENSKKETQYETQIEMTTIKMKLEHQQKDIEDLKKKSNNSENEIKQIKILETKFDSMQKQIDTMGLSQTTIISKLDTIINAQKQKV
jgi:DNA repair exonuclease SbcCD ATPase subunit